MYRRASDMDRLAADLLLIDAPRAAEAIETYIRGLVEEHSAAGVLMGLSGGIDSALLATLAVRAVGSSRVHAAFLYDRDSGIVPAKRSRLVAERLGIDLDVVDIEPDMRQRQVYAPSAVQLVSLSPGWNRHMLRFYRLFAGETPFVSILRRSGSVSTPVEQACNARHSYRREVLEQQALEDNRILLGAANRSEFLTGWFVKGGIDDLFFSPIVGLYKTQVRQLAAHLGLPDEIRSQAPSPDMIPGITDEAALGITYSKLDIIFDSLDRGLTLDDLVKMGLTGSEVRLARDLNRHSSWKRASEHADPPVDGGIHGGFRFSPVEDAPQ